MNKYSNNTLFLGYGYVAQYFCHSFSENHFQLSASINKTKEKYFKTPEKVSTIKFLEIDDIVLNNYDNFVISIPPFYNLKTDVIIDKFYDYFLRRKTPYKLIYLSATSVYGDHQGKKVQENSKLMAESINGIARISCEKKYLSLKENMLGNIIILRLAGIYGDKRNNILAISNKEILQNKFSNNIISRTHVEDIVAIIKKIILSSQIKNQIFNICDNHSCPTNEVNNYICEKLLKMYKLPIGNYSNESRNYSFSLDNKIVDNSKLKKILNYEFIFPSYKDGLKKIAANLNLT